MSYIDILIPGVAGLLMMASPKLRLMAFGLLGITVLNLAVKLASG
jgi:hypothetical protein